MIFSSAGAALSPDRPLHYVSEASEKANKTMQIRDGSRRGHRPHAADQARAGVGRDRLHHPRQGRVHEPRRLGEGPPRPPDDPGGREARRAQARRPGGRGHRRQHRHRPCARRQRARLSHADRHSRTPRARKRRTCCGSAAPSWSRCRPCPTAIPNNYQHVARRLADKLRKTEKNGVLFADQWNNRDNRLAHYLSTGPEIWERDATARSTASSARSAPAARSPAPRSSCARRRRTS